MATYTPIDDVRLEKILCQYDLGPLVSVNALKGGQANSSFKLVTEQGSFVISICDEKRPAEVRTLTRVLDLLEEHHFPTTRVIKAMDGRAVVDLEGKPVFVKTYIEGAVPDRVDDGMIHQVGRQLARLHRIPAPDDIPRQFAYGWERFHEIIDAATPHAGYRQWLMGKRDYLRHAMVSRLPQSMVHGDLFYDNTLFDGDRLVAILDFEEVCLYDRAFDIGMCLVGFCARDDAVSLERFRALAAGYESETLLTAEERRQLQPLAVLGAAATSFWRFRQYNIIFPGSDLSETYLDMSRFADQLQAYSPKAFEAAVFG
jgi:homoserine kinase type II